MHFLSGSANKSQIQGSLPLPSLPSSSSNDKVSVMASKLRILKSTFKLSSFPSTQIPQIQLLTYLFSWMHLSHLKLTVFEMKRIIHDKITNLMISINAIKKLDETSIFFLIFHIPLSPVYPYRLVCLKHRELFLLCFLNHFSKWNRTLSFINHLYLNL